MGSLNLVVSCCSYNNDETLPEILTRLHSVVEIESSGKKNIFNVNRDNVLDGALRAFKRPTFNQYYSPNVKFSGEDGIDDGGPSREFLRLLMEDVSRFTAFEGPESAKCFQLVPSCK